MNGFPEFACPYSKRLAAKSERFAAQVYDPPGGDGPAAEDGGAYGPDPFGELAADAVCPGLKQRFPDRVLVMASDRCFMNCRHCTRRGLLGKTAVVSGEDGIARCVEYVRAHPGVRDVLVSGGDPLVLSDAEVMRFIDAFAALPQIDIVRLCTRAPCTNPARVTDALAARLAASRKVWVNTQFNCADEVTDEAAAAASRLVDRGIPVSCQTVLLRGVNDSAGEMLRLFRALTRARIRPYYVFTCDPVAGIDRFRVPPSEARRIELECAAAIGGLSMPRFVSDIPGASRKIPVAEIVQGAREVIP